MDIADQLHQAAAAASETLVLSELGAAAIPAFKRAVAARWAVLTRHDGHEHIEVITGDLDDVGPEIYFGRYSRTDPLQRLVLGNNPAVTCASVAVDERCRQSVVFADFYRPRDIGHVMTMRLGATHYYEPGMVLLALFRPFSRAPFGREEARAATQVIPPLSAAVRRSRRAEPLLGAGRHRATFADVGSALSSLTAAERQVLDALGDGLSNVEIGRRLYISVHTVKTHVHRILAKLGVSSRLQAALFAAPPAASQRPRRPSETDRAIDGHDLPPNRW